MKGIDHPKLKVLEGIIRDLGSVVVAFSGGTDSTFLLAVCQRVLGENVMAITVKAPYIADWEIEEAIQLCKELGIRHKIIKSGIIDSIRNNPENRCYLCKSHLFTHIIDQATTAGYSYVVDGTNADDMGMHRPGLRALKELDIRSPLKKAGMGKELIRKLSSKLQLPTWNKPAYACLLTRIPYDTEISIEELKRIEEAEVFLIREGFRGVRVRSHGEIARIEASISDLPKLIGNNSNGRYSNYLKGLGYRYVTIDIDGYRSGSYDT